MRRALLILAAVAGALVVPAAPASAHGGDAPESTAYRTAVTGITPAVDGLRVRTVEAGARLELTNDTGRTIEVLGYAGEPYLEVRPDGAYENVNSPATYVNRTLAGDTPVPATADPTAPPQWRRVSGGTTVTWHDRRTHWTGPGLPPAAAAEPARSHRLRDWAVPLRDQARTFEIRGTLDYLPPPRARLWWAGALLLAVAAAAAAHRSSAAGGALALGAGTIAIAYGVTRALDSGVSLPLFVAGLLACAAGVWRAPFFTVLAGAVLAVFAGLGDLGVFRAAVVPAVGPAWFARVAVTVAIGVGAGLATAGVLRLRSLSEGGTKVPS